MPVKTALGPAEDPWHDIFRYGDKGSHPAYWSKTINTGSYHVTYENVADKIADKVQKALEDRKKTEPIALPSKAVVRDCPGDIVQTVEVKGGTIPEMLRALALRIQNDPEGEAEFVEVYTHYNTDEDTKFMTARLSS